MKDVKPDASAVFVPAAFAAKAIEETIEAEVPLVVFVTEHIPVHDMLSVHDVLRTQSKTRLVGPNYPGIIAPGQCRIGIMPYKQSMKGNIGTVSKSGTLSYEAVGATTKADLGQSNVFGMGGDMLPGVFTIPRIRMCVSNPYRHQSSRWVATLTLSLHLRLASSRSEGQASTSIMLKICYEKLVDYITSRSNPAYELVTHAYTVWNNSA